MAITHKEFSQWLPSHCGDPLELSLRFLLIAVTSLVKRGPEPHPFSWFFSCASFDTVMSADLYGGQQSNIILQDNLPTAWNSPGCSQVPQPTCYCYCYCTLVSRPLDDLCHCYCTRQLADTMSERLSMIGSSGSTGSTSSSRLEATEWLEAASDIASRLSEVVEPCSS